jgi:steroid 5-alpha reductase family enzyme
MSIFFDLIYIASVNIAVFSCAWIFCTTISRVSWIDVFWAASIGMWSIENLKFWESSFSFFTPLTLISFLYFFWSLRLSTHLSLRLMKHRNREDPRYEKIKITNSKNWRKISFFIFMMNAALSSLLILPQRLLLWSDTQSLNPTLILGVFLAILSITLESLADKQLKTFLSFKNNQGKTCKEGLWRYSRHPNYFFEWSFWMSISLCVIGYPHGYTALICPLIIYVFLTQFTGIKISEKDAATSRSDFLEYKQKTSAFFPLPPKK